MAENSHGRRYINLSNKRFDNRIYEEISFKRRK